jgi:hypothetical protein
LQKSQLNTYVVSYILVILKLSLYHHLTDLLICLSEHPGIRHVYNYVNVLHIMWLVTRPISEVEVEVLKRIQPSGDFDFLAVWLSEVDVPEIWGKNYIFIKNKINFT